MFTDPMWPIVATLVIVISFLLAGFFLLDKLFPGKDSSLKGFLIELDVTDICSSGFATKLKDELAKLDCYAMVAEGAESLLSDIWVSGRIERSMYANDYYLVNIWYRSRNSNGTLIGKCVIRGSLDNVVEQCKTDLQKQFQKWNRG